MFCRHNAIAHLISTVQCKPNFGMHWEAKKFMILYCDIMYFVVVVWNQTHTISELYQLSGKFICNFASIVQIFPQQLHHLHSRNYSFHCKLSKRVYCQVFGFMPIWQWEMIAEDSFNLNLCYSDLAWAFFIPYVKGPSLFLPWWTVLPPLLEAAPLCLTGAVLRTQW